MPFDKLDNTSITDRREILSSKKLINHQVAERIVQKLSPGSEFYRYDTIAKIEILSETETTYTMSVNDDLHQFVADGVIHKNTSFHLLMWCLVKLMEIAEKEGWKSFFCGQIHDSMILNVHPDEVDMVTAKIKQVCEHDMAARFKWLIIPYKVEIKMGEIDAPFNTMAEFVLK